MFKIADVYAPTVGVERYAANTEARLPALTCSKCTWVQHALRLDARTSGKTVPSVCVLAKIMFAGLKVMHVALPKLF